MNYRVISGSEFQNPASRDSMYNDLPGSIYDACAKTCASNVQGCALFVVSQSLGQDIATCEFASGGTMDLPAGGFGTKVTKWAIVS